MRRQLSRDYRTQAVGADDDAGGELDFRSFTSATHAGNCARVITQQPAHMNAMRDAHTFSPRALEQNGIKDIAPYRKRVIILACDVRELDTEVRPTRCDQLPATQMCGTRAKNIVENAEAPQNRIRAGRQAITARLGARKRVSLEQEDVMTGTGQQKRSCGAGRSTAHNHYIGAAHTRVTASINVTCHAHEDFLR